MRRRVVSNAVLLADVERLLLDGERVTLRCRGNSMLPFIVGGRDSVVLERYRDDESCRVGDVVFARLGEGVYVIHLVIAIYNIGVGREEFSLMGDGNERAVERVSWEQIIGVVRGVESEDGEYREFGGGGVFWWRVWNSFRCVRPLLLRVYYLFNRDKIDQI